MYLNMLIVSHLLCLFIGVYLALLYTEKEVEMYTN